MLKTLPWRMIAWGGSVGVLAGLLAVAFELDFPGEICEYNQATKHEDCTTYSFLPFLFIKVAKTLNDYGVAITALATVAIGVFTLTLKLSTDRLWEAGEKSRVLSEETAKRQLRAYIFIHQGEIKLINNDTAIMANILLKNCGATPGYDFKSWTNVRIGAPDEPIFGERKSYAQISIIGPLSDISAPSQFIPITPDERSSINNGAKKIFVWGEAVYRDAFGTSWTFLFKATNGGFVTNTENITGRLLWCGWGLNPAWYEENKS
jgi:hypothetical protein